MKKIASIILTTAALTAAVCATAAYDNSLDGARIDYLDASGKRVGSASMGERWYASVSQLFQFYPFTDEETGEKSITTIPYPRVNSVVMVPWSESNVYPMTVSTSGSDVKVSWEIMTDDEPSAKPAKEQSNSAEVNCGSRILYTIEVPDNSYPTVYIKEEYTMPEEYEGAGLSAFQAYFQPGFGGSVATLENMESRKSSYDMYHGKNYRFTRDEEKPNVWYFDWCMPNEPMSLTFTYTLPDNDMLREAAFCVASSLYAQHPWYDLGSRNNGEPCAMSLLGDYMGDAMVSAQYTGIDLSQLAGGTNSWSLTFWYNYMNLVDNANMLMSIEDLYTGADAEVRDYVKAQMLTLRAHAYWRLMQIFGPRWADSNGGSALVAPLETDYATEYLAPASMKQIADQCYSDLDDAIAIFSRSNCQRRYIVEPDINVARGVKMRVATLREDWQTAADMAKAITDVVAMTENSQLKGGMYNAAPSWIWGASNIYEGYDNHLYYWAFQCYNACNGVYPALWQMGTNAIDRDLFLSMDANDVRRSMFVMPENIKSNPITRRYATVSTWYNTDYVYSQNNFIGFAPTEERMQDWSTLVQIWAANTPDGCTPAFCYNYENEYFEAAIAVQYGAQSKFYSTRDIFDTPMDVVFMRADEAQLTLAEARWHLGDMNGAAAALNDFNALRITDYAALTPDAGQALLDAIMLSRRVEFWGEGFDWFDMKRWNTPRSRRLWEADNTESGNWPPNTNTQGAVSECNGWRLAIPAQVVNANPLFDINAFGYTDLRGYGETPQEAPAATAKATRFGTPVAKKASVSKDLVPYAPTL